ncbi:MAG: UPF0182 family protein [Longimicrobiales bacterium]
MKRHPARLLVPILLGLVLLLFAGRAAARFYTEVLWFQELGYPSVLWRRLGVEALVRSITTLVGGALVLINLWLVTRRLGPVHVRRRYGNLEISEQIPRRYVLTGIVITALLTGLWLSDVKFGGSQSLSVLTMMRQASWGVADPLFQRDLSFYVFSLPVSFQFVDFLLLLAFWSILLSVLGYSLVGAIRWRNNRIQLDDRARLHLALLFACAVALLGVRYWFSRYGVLFEGSGFENAVGYTDVHARLPAHRALAVMAVLVSGTIAFGALRRNLVVPIGASALLLVAAIVLGYLYPSVIQKLRVEPDQLRRELPYIRWNMEYTRRAFGLDSIVRRTYAYRPGMPQHAGSLSALPLWDLEPLGTVFNQLQSLFSYYRFPGIDADRYMTASGVRQVAIGVREFHAPGLQEANRTWQNLHLNPQLVRGLGAVVVPTAEKQEGNPVYWLHNLPVEMNTLAPAQLTLTEPSVYVGETTEEFAVLGTLSDTGAVGMRPRAIPLSSFLRVLAFAWRFSDKNLLFSGQLTDSSRILFRRSLAERLSVLAPFVAWDPDALPVIHRGRVHWLVDGYSATANFPIARPLSVPNVGNVRYLRPSVKALVDAVTGSVRMYALSEREPLLSTYRRLFPELFGPITELPAELLTHLRYPTGFLRAQSEVLEKYHIDRAESFYAGQDVWQLPRERGAEPGSEPFQPVYAQLALTPGARPEFVLAAPFIARQRQNLTALLMVRNDPPHYGELVLLELPRNQQIPGPAQVEALMEQDPVISPQLTLWRQAGSTVNLGHIRIVPVDSTLLYVVPVYLAARGRAIPELQRIIVSDGDHVTMATSLDDGLSALRGAPSTAPAATTGSTAPVAATNGWPQRALQLLEAAETSLRNGDWAGYGARLTQLRELLRQLARPAQVPR